MTFETAQGTKVKYAAKKIELEMDWGQDYMLIEYIALVLVPDSTNHSARIALSIYVGSECAGSEYDEYVLDKCVGE